MKNKQNEANGFECVLCEMGEGSTHGGLCSENKSEIEADPYKYLYELYLKNFDKDNGTPVCLNEWSDNELENLKEDYCRYLQDTVLDDPGFDVETTEDFWTWAEVEVNKNK